MFTVRNVFDIMYKGKLISYYVYEQNSCSKKNPSHLWCVFFENIEWFSTNKSVYKREHWQKSPRIVIHAYNVCGHDIHRNIVTLWMELNIYRFFFETVQPLIWWNIFSRLLTHRLTTAVVMFNGSRLCFVLTTLETNIITD